MKLLPALLPVIGRLARRDLHERITCRSLEIGQARQLTRSAVDGVLDHVCTDPSLLDAGRGKLEQFGEDDLGVRSLHTDG
jgi:hypothetical protein